MPNTFKSVHKLLAGKLLLQDKEFLQQQKLLLAANHPLEKARRFYEIVIKLPVIPAAITQAFYVALQQQNSETINLLTIQIMAMIKDSSALENEIHGTLNEVYVKAFLALTTIFQQKADTVNKNYTVLSLYHLPAQLLVSCPTYKNILLIELTENKSTHFPYKVTVTLNDTEKAVFSFDQQNREKDMWFELSFSAGNSYFTTQQIVAYWMPRLYQHTQKL